MIKRDIIQFLIVAALCLSIAVPALQRVRAAKPARTPQVLKLSQLEQIALKTYPGIKAGQHAISAAEAKLEEARWSPFFQFEINAGINLVPEVRGSALYSLDPQVPVSNFFLPVWSAGIGGAIPLWTFGKLSSAREAAQAGVKASYWDKQRVIAQLRTDIRRAYFTLQLALDLSQILSEAVSQLRRGIKEFNKRLSDGDDDVNELDQWRLSSALTEIQTTTSQVRRMEQLAREALSTLTSLAQVRVPECSTQVINHEVRKLKYYVELAATRRADQQMVLKGLDARKAAVDQSFAQYFPDFALTLGASTSYGPGVTDQTNPFIIDRANYTSYTAGIVARWKLDMPGNINRYRRAREEWMQAVEKSREVSKGVRIDISKAYEELLDARRQEQNWAAGKRNSRQWFVTAAQAYDLGNATAKDLIDSLKAYFTARGNHAQAIATTNIALAQLEQAVGMRFITAAHWDQECDGP